MSTNFYINENLPEKYIRNGRHIGKLSFGEFIWAVDPDLVEELCITSSKVYLFVDEYGKTYSCKDFKEMLNKCTNQKYGMVGIHFS